jgi:hypothetical protein
MTFLAMLGMHGESTGRVLRCRYSRDPLIVALPSRLEDER